MNRVIENRFPGRTQRIQLFESPVAAAHARRQNQ